MKIQIKILGTGCPKCQALEKRTKEVVNENNFDAEIIKVEDISNIISFGVLGTPGFVINEKVIFSGRLPSKDEIKEQIEKAL